MPILFLSWECGADPRAGGAVLLQRLRARIYACGSIPLMAKEKYVQDSAGDKCDELFHCWSYNTAKHITVDVTKHSELKEVIPGHLRCQCGRYTFAEGGPLDFSANPKDW